MAPADIKSVGIIGAGRIGRAMAQIASRAGRPVVIANRHGPQSLASVVQELGDRVPRGRSRRPPLPTSSCSQSCGRTFAGP